MLSVLLMIRVNHAQRKVMGGRRVPCLDDYLDRVQLMLWPRFKVGTVDMHVESRSRMSES